MPATSLDLSRALKELALAAGRLPQGARFLPAALDALAGIVPYDLAAVLRLEQDHLRVVCARGPLADLPVRHHSLALARFPSIGEALRTGLTRVMTERDHAQGDGDPYDGLLDLPHGHACMVVPLQGGGRPLGALTFDRATCGAFEPMTVSLATIYGQLIALTWMALEQNLDQRERLEAENRLLRREAAGGFEPGALMARSLSPVFRQVTGLAQQVAGTDSAVLILGETGTGKEVLARAIHAWSRRAEQPFLRLNCAALPEHLVESELFGHTRGAFSGASQARPGRFQVAHGGTLLLDEIGDLPLGMQAKLLRVLQEGTVEPVGSDRTVTVDVRILASTNLDLELAVAEGRFRPDLYYRLNVFPLRLPPLRERREDILPLAEAWLHRQALRTGLGPWRIPPLEGRKLEDHPWTGNVRELINVLERATILTPHGDLVLEPAPHSPRPLPCPPGAEPPPGSLSQVERTAILEALRHTGGKVYGSRGAAQRLGLKPTTLQSRMKKLGITRLTNFA